MKNNKLQKQKILYVPPKIHMITSRQNYCADGSVARATPECTNGAGYNIPICSPLGMGANACNATGQGAEACAAVGNMDGQVCAFGTGE